MIVGTAGHIDHGKTTLVRALTGVDTDRLKEERERGITIELGYAYVPLPGDGVLGFIDVPGHERLIHTMVAGAAGIDFALLVIAADDGIMPQTREHLAILGLLGVSQGAVALTKGDRVEPARMAAVREEVQALLAAGPLARAPVFEVRATAPGDPGVAALAAHLHAAAAAWEAGHAGRADGLFRLAIDRVFTLAGQGTVVTGTVFAGAVHVGDSLVLAPSGTPVRVRSLHTQGRPAASGQAGERCALNLPGIEKSAISRGDWVMDARTLAPSLRLDVRLRRLADGGPPLVQWAPVHVHLGTAHHVAHLSLLDDAQLVADASARVQLVFDTPVCAVSGDRFIVRNAQASATLGGGRVLDPYAPQRRRRTPQRRAWLDALERMLEGAGPGPVLACAGPGGMRLSALVRLTGLPPERLHLPAELRRIPAAGAAGDAFLLLPAQWADLSRIALEALAAFHLRQPDEPGPDAARLRRIAAPELDETLWRACLDALEQDGAIARSGAWLHLPGHVLALDAEETALAEALLPLLHAGRFDPPWVRDLARVLGAPEERVRAVLRKLVRQGRAHQVVPDLFYHPDCLRELADLAAAASALTASAYRDATGLGRKRAIQVLEFFDRVGYTRRIRDRHVLRGAAWMAREEKSGAGRDTSRDAVP